jgi:hypothetical protein
LSGKGNGYRLKNACFMEFIIYTPQKWFI